jgi:hypothetical protein
MRWLDQPLASRRRTSSSRSDSVHTRSSSTFDSRGGRGGLAAATTGCLPSTTRRMASASWRLDAPGATMPSAPAAIGSPRALAARSSTLVVGEAALIAAGVPAGSPPGRWASSSSTQGRWAAASSTTRQPSWATPQTVKSTSASRIIRSPSASAG